MIEKPLDSRDNALLVEKYKQTLVFVILPSILKHIGDIPEWATGQGYNPETHEQMSIFGDEKILQSFISDFQLPSEFYPIHDAKMGVHIDIYSPELIESVKEFFPLTEAMNYWKQRKNNLSRR